MDVFIGIAVGLIFIALGYMIRTKQTLFFLAGFRETWSPVHEARLSHRVGILVIGLGLVAIATAIFGPAVETLSVLAAIALIIAIIGVIVVDQVGY